VPAYGSQGMPLAASLADVFAQEWYGRALVLSASGSRALASSFAVHPELLSTTGADHWNAHAYALNVQEGEEGESEGLAFASAYDVSPCEQVFALRAEELAASVGEVEGVYFNVTEHFTLFAELAFINNLISKLKSHPLVSDNVPDMYTFVFSGLKEIQQKYGAHSTTFLAALSLVEPAASKLITALNELYAARVATAIVSLNPRAYDPASPSARALKETVYNKVARLLYDPDDFETHYPALYVHNNELVGYARELMCSNLQKAVDRQAIVTCPSIGSYPFLAANDTSNTTNTTTNDTATVVAFWLNFFVTLVIALFVLWGVYCLTYVGIDASKDSLLYRATGRQQPR